CSFSDLKGALPHAPRFAAALCASKLVFRAGGPMPVPDELVLISPDSHIMERPELWVERLSGSVLDRLPDAFRPRPPGAQNGARPAREPGEQGGATADRRSNTPIFNAGIDPHQRVPEMEQDGLTAEVLYCTRAMQLFHLEDAELQE